MFKQFKIAKSIKITVTVLAAFLLVAFANKQYDVEVCNDIIVSIQNQRENYYVDKKDLMDLVNRNGEDVVIGKTFNAINLKEIERRIIESAFIKETEVYKDLKGNLIVNAHLRRPIARIIRNKNNDAYVSEEGELLPVSEKYTSRVVLISGKGGESILEKSASVRETNTALFEMINFINADPFWKAQIAQIDINEFGEAILYPQVTKQQIEFGKIEDVETKFKKLKVFYDRVLPLKGWNYYDKVNLKYEGQIIAD